MIELSPFASCSHFMLAAVKLVVTFFEWLDSGIIGGGLLYTLHVFSLRSLLEREVQ